MFKLLSRLGPQVCLKSKYGVKLRNFPHDLTNFFCLTTNRYNTVFQQVSKLEEGMCFIDIGANIGLFSLIASKHVGEDGLVVAFEPYLDTYLKLLQNPQLNHCRNVFPVMVAITLSTAIKNFRASPYHSGINQLSDEGEAKVFCCNPGQDLTCLEKLIGKRPVMIKIDVEGHELKVLKALEPLFNRLIIQSFVVEVDEKYLHTHGDSKGALMDFMTSHGFAPNVQKADSKHYDEIFTPISSPLLPTKKIV